MIYKKCGYVTNKMYNMFFLARNFVCGVDSLDIKPKIHKNTFKNLKKYIT